MECNLNELGLVIIGNILSWPLLQQMIEIVSQVPLIYEINSMRAVSD
jgi:hypothetical protein